jgi:hypothetical protein
VVDAAKQQAVWSLQGNLAELNCGNLSGRIDTARPHSGLRETALGHPHGVSSLLGVHRVADSGSAGWPLMLTDTYVRGRDLVASYTPSNDWPFSPQLYWRAHPFQSIDGVLASMSLLVSVQTHLLDTCPRIGVATQLPRGELSLVSMHETGRPNVDPIKQGQSISPSGEEHCVVARPSGLPFSYVEIMPSSDFHEVVLRPESEHISFEWRLFADFLEKGVIRRARVLAAVLARENDIQVAADCCKAIERLELPLTT